MNTATLTPARLKRVPRQRGAQPGNTNQAKEAPKDSHLHMRCHASDKGQWTEAANSAVKRGALVPDSRGNLASWVVDRLNHSAKEEKLTAAAVRKK